jgi:hypothetical protein
MLALVERGGQLLPLKRWHLISGPWLSQVLARPRRGGAFRLRGTLGLAWSGWRPGRLEAV